LTLLITPYLESSPHKQGLPPPLPLWTLQWHVCKQIQNYILKPIQNHVVIIRSGCGTNSRLPVGPIQTLVPVACIHEQQEAGNWLPWEVQTIQIFHYGGVCPKNWPKPACGSSHCGPNCISTNPLQHLLHSNPYIVLNLYRKTFCKLMLWVISCMSPIQAQASSPILDPRPHITACLLALYCTNRHTEDNCPLCNLSWSFLQLCTTSPSLFSNCRLPILVSSPIESHQWRKSQVI
jgi:hypothetical protein